MKHISPLYFDLPEADVDGYGCEDTLKPADKWLVYDDLRKAIDDYLGNECFFNSTTEGRVLYLGAFKLRPTEERTDENMYELIKTVRVEVRLNVELIRESENSNGAEK